MARPCNVCTSPDRAAIDAALISGEPNRRVATKYDLSEPSVRRHRRDHLSTQIAESEAIAADDLLAQVHRLQSSTLSILQTAESSGKMTTALSAVREARGNIELLAKLTRQIDDRQVTNVLIAPEWLTVRAVIFEALKDYPDARTAVAGRLHALESGP